MATLAKKENKLLSYLIYFVVYNMFVVVFLFFKENPLTAISKPFTVSEGSTLYYSVTQVTALTSSGLLS